MNLKEKMEFRARYLTGSIENGGKVERILRVQEHMQRLQD